jgi:PAS domain S-box-containing protein
MCDNETNPDNGKALRRQAADAPGIGGLGESFSDSMFRSLFEQSPTPMAIAKITGELTYNAACIEHFGLTAADGFRQGMNYFEMERTWQEFDSAGRELATEDFPMARALRGESTKDFEIRIITKDGCEKWKIINAAPMYDNTGGLIAGFVTFSEITERKLAEKQIRESERQSRAWLEHSPICTKKVDLDFNLQYMSASGVKALGLEDITEYYGKPYPLDFYPDAFKENMIQCLETVRDTGEIVAKENSIADLDGNPLWFHSTLVPVFDDAAQLDYIIVVSIETTERRLAEEELRETNARLIEQTSKANELTTRAESANIAKSEFLANMSHEIRTPMTAILGFAETVADSVQNPENINAIATVRRNGEFLLDIINDILDISKIETGKMAVEIDDYSPCEVVNEVVRLVENHARDKGLAFNVEFVGEIPEMIRTDATRLRQILINLVGNAIKFTERGEVRLVTRFVADGTTPSLRFDVVDTGIGMAEDQAARLFKPFVQADNSITREFGGTGLGLAISKRFAEMLGGDITIAASELGVGTNFRATISTGAIEGVRMIEGRRTCGTGSEAGGSPSALVDLSGYRVLVAEDGLDNQRLISFVLTKAGAEVVSKENGKLALEAALEAQGAGRTFDCILMDVQMPVMSGLETTAALRAVGYTAPIIALTAHAMASDRRACLEAGCDDFATKPIDRAQLIGLIARHIGSARAAA